MIKMGLLNKLKAAGGVGSIAFGSYMFLSPQFGRGILNYLYNNIDFLPEGQSPIGVDYKTILSVSFAITSIIGGAVALYDL